MCLLPMCQLKTGSQLSVKYQTIKYWPLCRVRSVSPTQIEIFSIILAQMFTSYIRSINPIPSYNVSAQGQCHN